MFKHSETTGGALRCGAWLLAMFIALLVVGCRQQAAVPPPSFDSPTIRPDGPVVLPTQQKQPASPAKAAPRPAGPQKGIVSGRVVLDPGHGGKDPGAQAGSIDEKNINLAVAKLTAKKLSERGVTVILTRDRDVFIELVDRAQVATTYRADLFVSIHADSNPDPGKSGHSVLLPRSGNRDATEAGQFVSRRLVQGGSPSRAVRVDDRGLVVLKRTACPAILVELGFLSNRAEAQRLASPAYQEALAEAIAAGVTDFLKQN